MISGWPLSLIVTPLVSDSVIKNLVMTPDLSSAFLKEKRLETRLRNRFSFY